MIAEELTNYKRFVIQKAAPTRPIDSEEFEYLHAALGLSTEYLELLTSTDSDHTREELGDMLWYFTYTALLVPMESRHMETVWYNCKYDASSNSLSLKQLGVSLERLISQIKKLVIYDQNVSTYDLFVETWMNFCVHLRACGIDLAHLIEENKVKLSARYESSFTTQESESRNDKIQ